MTEVDLMNMMMNRPRYSRFQRKSFATGQYAKDYPNQIQKSKGISPIIIVVLVVFGLIGLYLLTQSSKSSNLYELGYSYGYSETLENCGTYSIFNSSGKLREIYKSRLEEIEIARNSRDPKLIASGVRTQAQREGARTVEEYSQFQEGVIAGTKRALQEILKKLE